MNCDGFGVNFDLALDDAMEEILAKSPSVEHAYAVIAEVSADISDKYDLNTFEEKTLLDLVHIKYYAVLSN